MNLNFTDYINELIEKYSDDNRRFMSFYLSLLNDEEINKLCELLGMHKESWCEIENKTHNILTDAWFEYCEANYEYCED